MARENRKAALVFVIKTGKKISISAVFTYKVWSVNLGFGKSIQSYSSNESKTAIVRVVESPSIRGGDLGKSGPRPDAARNVRKTGGGSLFAQGFTLRSYHNNKPLSC